MCKLHPLLKLPSAIVGCFLVLALLYTGDVLVTLYTGVVLVTLYTGDVLVTMYTGVVLLFDILTSN